MILLQKEIINIVTTWTKNHDKPIPLQEIIKQEEEINPRTVRVSVDTLCKKGYLRRSCQRGYASYVQLRKL